MNHPVVLPSTYVAVGQMGYGRSDIPTWSAFEEALGALEDGRGLASVLAALAALFDPVPAGGVLRSARRSQRTGSG